MASPASQSSIPTPKTFLPFHPFLIFPSWDSTHILPPLFLPGLYSESEGLALKDHNLTPSPCVGVFSGGCEEQDKLNSVPFSHHSCQDSGAAILSGF